MHQLAGARTRALGQIVLLAEEHREPTPGGIARDASTIDAAADDEKIIYSGLGTHVLASCHQHGLTGGRPAM
ncbi:hypothetical protein D3C71_1828670 [compost metagenome]